MSTRAKAVTVSRVGRAFLAIGYLLTREGEMVQVHRITPRWVYLTRGWNGKTRRHVRGGWRVIDHPVK